MLTGGNPLLADHSFLSLSATEKIWMNNDSPSRSTISSWFLLESDIRGPVEDPSYYFDPDNARRFDDLDLLLCTQGWRDFEWKYDTEEYPAEHGFYISGRVNKLITDKPLKNSNVTAILISGENEILLTSSVDSSGTFHSEEFDLTGKGRLIVSATGEKGKLQGNLIVEDPVYIPEKLLLNESVTHLLIANKRVNDDNLTTLQKQYEIKSSIKKKYSISDTILLGEIEIFSQQKNEPWVNYQTQRIAVGIPDNIIEMTPELQNRTDIRDVIRNRVAGLTFEPINDVEMSGIRIRGSRLEPLFMLDGIIVPFGNVASLPLAWIERIEILKSGGIATTMMNSAENDDALKFNGVISVITKPEEERTERDQVFHSVNKIITGFDAPRIFYSPDYSSGSDSRNIPDFRSTLFWEPNIMVGSNKDYVLSYCNADNSATIIITAEGMTTTGIPVTGSFEYVIE